MLAMQSPIARAEWYASISPAGELLVSAKRLDETFKIFLPPTAPLPPQRIVRPRWHALIEAAGRAAQVDARLLHAIVRVESGYNPRARSPKGAIGLMQVMPSTGRMYGAANLNDPVENLRVGASYLKWLLRQFDGDVRLALAAYNAGSGAVARYGRIPPYAETQNYVRRVMAYYRADA